MTVYFRIIVLVILTGLFTNAAVAAPEIDVILNLELLLVNRSGTYPMTTKELNIGYGGGFNQTVKLDEDDPASDSLVYRLGYRMIGTGRIQLTLKREIYNKQGSAGELPDMVETISTLESWTATVFEEDDRLGGKLTLRVVPMLRQKKFDEDFDSWRVPMSLMHGPMLEYVERNPDRPEFFQDQIHHREVNGGGLGLEFGIPSFGVVRVSHYRFPDATPCGWVRKTRYYFSVGGRSFGGWSVVEILPEDPERPGKGWTLYCTMESDPKLTRGFSGGFNPFEVD